MKRTLAIITMGALASCANTQKPATFWNEKGGIAIVHHVSAGGKDHEEKLTEKPADNIDGKYFKVAEVDSSFTVAKKKEKPPQEKVDTGKLESKIADLQREVDSLKTHQDIPGPQKRNLDLQNASASAAPQLDNTTLPSGVQEAQ